MSRRCRDLNQLQTRLAPPPRARPPKAAAPPAGPADPVAAPSGAAADAGSGSHGGTRGTPGRARANSGSAWSRHSGEALESDAVSGAGLTFKILRAAVLTQPRLCEYFEAPFDLTFA